MSYVSGLFFLDGQTSDLLDSVFQGLESTTLVFNHDHFYHLVNAYHVPGSVQNILHVFSHLIFILTEWNR